MTAFRYGRSQIYKARRAGLEILVGNKKYPEAPGYEQYVRAADVEKMLESAPVVYGHKNQYDIND